MGDARPETTIDFRQRDRRVGDEARGKFSRKQTLGVTEPTNGAGVFAASDRFSIPRPRRDCVDRLIDARAFDSAQVVYNMLDPSAATELPSNYPAQAYRRLFDHTTAAGVGVVGIRVVAGGALSSRLRGIRLRGRPPSQSARP